MKLIDYDRFSAVEYARKYALKRKFGYVDVNQRAGDSTNFCSQCLFAGSKTMNLTPTIGWYYKNAGDFSPSWIDPSKFYTFLTENLIVNKIGNGYGPMGELKPIESLDIGDFIQIARNGLFAKTLIIVGFNRKIPLVATHSKDAYKKPLTEYNYKTARGVHVLGVRV